MRDVISFIFQMRKPRLRGIKYLIQGHFVRKEHHEFEQTLGDNEGQGGLARWSLGITELDMT